MASPPRVRFAPSPTGSLHIGSARTALFNHLYARATGGTSILRIEDTDEARSTDASLKTIIDGLRWLGLHWDEGPGATGDGTDSVGEYGPYFQSQRKARHAHYAQQLLASGHAHWVDAEYGHHDEYAEELALAFRCPKNQPVTVYDKIKGEVVFNSDDIGDFVIVKSNGTALYNFAVVCDDLDMQITHVLRGDDHLSNTPKQILIYQALGQKPPIFAHIPLIHDEDGQKISKRKQYAWAAHTDWYREQGFLPEAFVNYLARLCWSDGTDNEFWTLEQLEKRFSLKGIQSTPARFGFDKLKWFNGKYIRECYKAEPARFFALLLPHFEQAGLLDAHPTPAELARAKAIGALLHDRLEYFAQVGELADYFYAAPKDYPDDEVEKAKISRDTLPLLKALHELFAGTVPWDQTSLEMAVRALAEQKGVKLGELIHPLRLALTGRTASPGMFEVLGLLERAEVCERLRRFHVQMSERFKIPV